MITVWNANSRAEQKNLSERIVEFLYVGLEHENSDVRRRIREATHLASRAASENAESSMVVASLLYIPCQMLARSEYSIEMWSGDSLLESGTHDWLLEHFGADIAEVIRLQPHAFRQRFRREFIAREGCFHLMSSLPLRIHVTSRMRCVYRVGLINAPSDGWSRMISTFLLTSSSRRLLNNAWSPQQHFRFVS